MKKILASILVITVICCLCLTSCTSISRNEAEALLKDFFTALVAEDYETAASYMHPAANVDADSLRTTIETMEEQMMCDFSDGFELGSCTYLYASANFNTNGISGAYNALSMNHEVKIGTKSFILDSSVIGDTNGITVGGFRLGIRSSVSNEEV